MIWFARLAEDGSDPTVLTLHSYLPLGMRDNDHRTFAIDLRRANEGTPPYGTIRLHNLSADAVQNASPFMPVRQVWAGGGVVARQEDNKLEILTIKRRRVWDLPKGKQDAGESIHQCAIREVQEEVGASQLRLVSKLGITSHGYGRGGLFMAKTTHWYLMTSNDRSFSPQQTEDIVEVGWMPYRTAVDRMGYLSLRTALIRWEDAIRNGVFSQAASSHETTEDTYESVN